MKLNSIATKHNHTEISNIHIYCKRKRVKFKFFFVLHRNTNLVEERNLNLSSKEHLFISREYQFNKTMACVKYIIEKIQ